ncbi:MAG: small multi-drug export protein [Candidatus Aenigmatarchaeota archaeon]
MLEATLMVIIANISPALEQIGGIPIGLALGLDPLYTLLVSLTVNCLLFFPVYFGLKLFYDRVFSRIKLFNKYLEKVRRKGKPYIIKYGILGLTAFISLPTPLTGTYTASILSWFLDLDWKKSFIAIAIGSTIGGVLILATSLGFIEALKLIFSV